MAVNSSSSTNDTFLQPNLPSGVSCLFIRPHSLIFTAFNITNALLLLPLCILIFQRWQQQRSISTVTASHSDSFTYHMVAIELVGLLGHTIMCFGIHQYHVTIFYVGVCIWSTTWYGKMWFHVLTCVERYLAVIHPVTYLSLKRERGIRIRNITIGCVWLLSFGSGSLVFLYDDFYFVDICTLSLSLIVVTFCSLVVLCVLIRPGPGEQGGDRERVDRSKRRAFYTIVAILGVLSLRFCWNLVWVDQYVSKESIDCVVQSVELWFNLPSSLVLPLLYLQRAGMLACCKKNSK